MVWIYNRHTGEPIELLHIDPVKENIGGPDDPSFSREYIPLKNPPKPTDDPGPVLSKPLDPRPGLDWADLVG